MYIGHQRILDLDKASGAEPEPEKEEKPARPSSMAPRETGGHAK
jgi:hypothetical protein